MQANGLRVKLQVQIVWLAISLALGTRVRTWTCGRRCCWPSKVVAQSRVPQRPRDRVKTDCHDGLALARLHRAGEFSPVDVP